jgi:hypothetical protein
MKKYDDFEAGYLSAVSLHNDYVCVEKAAKELGIEIALSQEFDDKDIVSELSFVKDKPKITLNFKDNSYHARKRYNIAFQIGHFCTQEPDRRIGFVDNLRSIDPASSTWNSYAFKAHNYAHKLLMPLDLVSTYAADYICNHTSEHGAVKISHQSLTCSLAERFDVPTSVMRERLKFLGIIH